MDNNLITLIISNAPNFIGFIIALIIANRAMMSEKKRADKLLQHFIDCQDDRVKETPQTRPTVVGESGK